MMDAMVRTHPTAALFLLAAIFGAVGYFEHRVVKNPEVPSITWFFAALPIAAAIFGFFPAPMNWLLSAVWISVIIIALTRYLNHERKLRRNRV